VGTHVLMDLSATIIYSEDDVAGFYKMLLNHIINYIVSEAETQLCASHHVFCILPPTLLVQHEQPHFGSSVNNFTDNSI
jgi:hypothetical protein